MRPGRARHAIFAAVAAAALFGASKGTSAVQEGTRFPDMELGALVEKAGQAYPERLDEAIPYLEAIRERLKEARTQEYVTIFKNHLFVLGLAYMKRYEQSGETRYLEKAIGPWETFTKRFQMDPRYEKAVMNRGNSYFGAGRYEEAIPMYKILLSPTRVHEMSKENRLSVLKRLTQTYRELERWDDAIPYLWEITEGAAEPELRLYAVNALLDGFLNAGKLASLKRILPLIRQDALYRYDLGINLRLIRAGDTFESEDRFFEASLVYSMVLPLRDILERIENRLIAVEEQLFQGRFFGTQEEDLREERAALRARRRELVEANDYTAGLKWRQARVLRRMGRRFESFFAFDRLVDQYPAHERIEQFHYAAFAQALACDYAGEAIELGEAYLDNSAYVAYEKPIAGRLARVYRAQGRIEPLASLADRFVHRFPDDPVAAQVTHALGRGWFEKGRVARVLETFPRWKSDYPDGAFVPSALYWTGMARLFEGEPAAALEDFERLLDAYPGSVYKVEAEFRRGVSKFAMGENGAARQIFTAWVEAHPKHALRPEAELFLGDLDAMAAKVEPALGHYRAVEELGGAPGIVERAYFEAARLLQKNGRYEEHDAWMERFLERYGERPAAAEAVFRLAESAKERGRISLIFERYRLGLDRFGNRKEATGVDDILEAWWSDYHAVRERARATNAFMKRLLEDAAFRVTMIRDRVAQIRHFRERDALDDRLAELLNDNRELRKRLRERTPEAAPPEGPSPEPLAWEDFPEFQGLARSLREDMAALPDRPPAEVFRRERADARSNGRLTLALRLTRVLHQRGEADAEADDFGPEAIEAASPAVRVWIAKIIREARPDQARELLRGAAEEAPESEAAAEALFVWAGLEAAVGEIGRARDLYRRLAENYPERPKAREAVLAEGDMLRRNGRPAEAREAYQRVLERREWRGEAWAEATFKIGLCFRDEGALGQAQGFFERAYLAYGGIAPWGPRAYLESGKVLEKRGEIESARRTYERFLERHAGAAGEVRAAIEERLAALPPPPETTKEGRT